jgi:hypothetical protein
VRGDHSWSLAPCGRERDEFFQVRYVVAVSVADDDRVESTGARVTEERGKRTESAVEQYRDPSGLE